MKWAAIAAVIIGVGMAVWRIEKPIDVAACSTWAPESQDLPRLVADSPIIAIGTITDAVGERATLRVDDAIKGTFENARIPVDNRTTGSYFDCGPVDAFNPEWDRGDRFSEGDRVLLFLSLEMAGVWHVGHVSFAAYELPADEFAPLIQHRDPEREVEGEVAPQRLDAITGGLSSLSFGNDASAEAEDASGCQGARAGGGLFDEKRISTYAALSSAAAIVTVIEAPSLEEGPDRYGPAHVRVAHVLGGHLDDREFTFNQRWVGEDYTAQDCRGEVAEGGLGLVTGEQYLVFLRKDEFGIADYRAVSWNQALVQVNERYVIGRRITLEAVRRVVGAEADGSVVAKDSDGEWFVQVATVMLGLAAMATVASGVRAARDT